LFRSLPADGLHAGEVRQLGEETLEDAGLEEDLEPDGRLRRGDDLLELVGDALHAEDLDAAGLLLHRAERLDVDREAELGGEAGGAEHPERVVLERGARIERRAEPLADEVDDAAEGVEEVAEALGVEGEGEGVDREVAPGLVVLERAVLDDRL